jgi:hypothetical protein
MAERRGVYRILVGKPEEKTQLGGPTLGMDNIIKTDLQKIGLDAWIGPVWLRKGRGSRRL